MFDLGPTGNVYLVGVLWDVYNDVSIYYKNSKNYPGYK